MQAEFSVRGPLPAHRTLFDGDFVAQPVQTREFDGSHAAISALCSYYSTAGLAVRLLMGVWHSAGRFCVCFMWRESELWTGF
jgi:hypothetical protein